eukprot:m.70709 g.70709  ORF g.70709 m.70709 type:complete len:435 (-) comp20104_c0_seq5:33-1337(-)
MARSLLLRMTSSEVLPSAVCRFLSSCPLSTLDAATKHLVFEIVKYIVALLGEGSMLDINTGLECVVSLAKTPGGSPLLAEAQVVHAFKPLFTHPVVSIRTSAMYVYCCALHNAQTRNEMARQTIECDLVVPMLSSLSDEHISDAKFLSLNWFGGCETGTVYLLDHLDKIIGAYQDPRYDSCVRSLRLMLANMPALLTSPEKKNVMVQAGVVDVLLPYLETRCIEGGYVGVLMGMANLSIVCPDKVGEALRLDDNTTRDLVQCLDFAIKGVAQENILWSPWEPAQGIACLCALHPENNTMLLKHGILPLLLKCLSPDLYLLNTQADCSQDQLGALRALEVLAYHEDLQESDRLEIFESVSDCLRTSIFLEANGRALAYNIIELVGDRKTVLLPLKNLCRAALRKKFGTRLSLLASSLAEELHIPPSLVNFLRFER